MFELFENTQQNDNIEIEKNGIIEKIVDVIEDVLGLDSTSEPPSAEVYDYLDSLDSTDEFSVTGNPQEALSVVDYEQGDNIFNVDGCCGLVSSSNFLNMCGLETTENEIVGFALANDLCSYSLFAPPESNGGTNDAQIEAVIEAYGIPVTAYETYDGGSIDDIADAIDDGRAVTIGVNAGFLWNEASCLGDGSANHQITVTGVVRDAAGNVAGLVVCDSGRGLESDAARVLTREELINCYETVAGSSAIISDNSVR